MRNQWFIGIKKRGQDILDFTGFERIEPPKGTYQADPFIVSHNGIEYLFYEWYDYVKGKIAFSVIEDGKMTEPKIVLEKPFHLSFPSIFRENGDFYMIPEAAASGQLWIYKAKNFPYEWEPIKLVAEGWFGDPVMFKEEGFFKIYTTFGDNNLRVFRAQFLDGQWDLIKSEDIQNARSAGNFFFYDGSYVRPVQECQGNYGRAVILKKWPENTTIKTLEPTWYPGLTGTHTFNFSDKYVVVDGRIKL